MMEKDEKHLLQVYVCKHSRPGKLKETRALHAVTQLKRWNNRDAGDSLHGWSAVVHRCKLFRRDGEVEEGRCLVFEGAAQMYGTIKSLRESMWVRSRGEAVLVTLWWQRVADPPTRREDVDEVFLKAHGEVSVSHTLVLMGNFNIPETCLQDGRTQAVREISGEHQGQLLAAGTGGTSRGHAQLDLLFSNRGELFSGHGNQ